jgi:hypothetical protein
VLAQALAPWEDVGTGQTGPARATFRLTEIPAELDGVLFGEDAGDEPREPAAAAPGEQAGDEPGTAAAGAPGDHAGGEPGTAADGASGEHADQAVAGPGAPGHDGGREPGWRLEFLLQSVADPSLLIGAEQTWADDGTLSRWLPRPQELLLAELGRASRVYPELANGLRQPRPCALDLDADGAYRFPRDSSPWTRPGSACCCRPGGTAAASSGSPRPRTPRPTAWWASRASSARTSSWSSAGGSRSATTR